MIMEVSLDNVGSKDLETGMSIHTSRSQLAVQRAGNTFTTVKFLGNLVHTELADTWSLLEKWLFLHGLLA